MADFTAAEVEDGTGLSTAVVYETVATTDAWLLARDASSSFAAAAENAQKRIALTATEELDDLIMQLGFAGSRVQTGQGLLWPALGAYMQQGWTVDPDTVPPEYLEAYRLICEERSAGTWATADPSNIKARSAQGVSTTFRHDAASLRRTHPAIYRRLRRCLPQARAA